MSKQEEIVRIAFALGALAVGIAGCGILGWQVLHFLQWDEWRPVSAIDALAWLGNEWAFFPNQWYGAHHLLTKLPASIACGAIAITIIAGLANE